MTTGSVSRKPVPRYINCYAIVALALDPQKRYDQAQRFSAFATTVSTESSFSLTFYSKSWAIHIPGVTLIKGLILDTVGWALLVVTGVLVVSLPIARAIVAVFNIAAILAVVGGYMHFTSVSFSPISYVTLVMAVGFCVDYTVHVMHFSSLPPYTDTGRVKMLRGLQLCAYEM